MKDLSAVVNASGSFPQVVAADKSGLGATDGTALQALWLSEVFSALQATLNGAGITPSGATDTCGATSGDVTGSQFVEALQLMLAVPGEIVGYPSDTLPSGARLIKLQGQAVALADYPRLANVYVGDPDNPTAAEFFRCTNPANPYTSRSTSGAYFKLPDYRGRFLRGRDAGALYDPDGAVREYGDTQGCTVEEHYHDHLYVGSTEVKTTALKTFPVGLDTVLDLGGSGTAAKTGHVDASTPTSAETRPVNQCVTWCIRY